MSRQSKYQVPQELQEVLLDFTVQYLVEQPEVLADFAVVYFTRLQAREKPLHDDGQSDESMASDGEGGRREMTRVRL